MRLALVSDIHGNLAALEAVVADLERRRVDHVVNLGDHLSGPLLPRETARRLMALDWPSIAGNHDRQLVTLPPDDLGPSDRHAWSEIGPPEIQWLRSHPAVLRWREDLFLVHGTPSSDEQVFLDSVEHGALRLARLDEIASRRGDLEAAVIACGHSHVPRVVRDEHGRLLVNPGSVGLPAYTHDVPSLHVIQMGSPDARYAILESTAGGWIVELLAVPYDHEARQPSPASEGDPIGNRHFGLDFSASAPLYWAEGATSRATGISPSRASRNGVLR